MRFALSARVIEVDYRECLLPVRDFLEFARATGYDAVELRATQFTPETTQGTIREIARQAEVSGLRISAINLPAVAQNKTDLSVLDRYAHFARLLGGACLKCGGEPTWLRVIADCAAVHGVRVIVQLHVNSPFERVAQAAESHDKIGRANFGLMYDAANLFLADETDWAGGIQALGRRIIQVSVQNIGLAEEDAPAETWSGRRFRRYAFGEPGGIDYYAVVLALRRIGFDGYLTLNEALLAGRDYEDVARQGLAYLKETLRRADGAAAFAPSSGQPHLSPCSHG